METLSWDDRDEQDQEEEAELESLGIIESEVQYAIKCTKNRKALGGNKLPVEIKRCLDTKTITVLFNNSPSKLESLPGHNWGSFFCEVLRKHPNEHTKSPH